MRNDNEVVAHVDLPGIAEELMITDESKGAWAADVEDAEGAIGSDFGDVEAVVLEGHTPGAAEANVGGEQKGIGVVYGNGDKTEVLQAGVGGVAIEGEGNDVGGDGGVVTAVESEVEGAKGAGDGGGVADVKRGEAAVALGHVGDAVLDLAEIDGAIKIAAFTGLHGNMVKLE